MRLTLLQMWHLLSLDAPTVATLWTVFVARTTHISLPWQAPAAMFLAVWILYAADRLLDAREGSPEALEERHRFHDRHRRAFLTGIAAAALGLAALTPELLPAALRLYALLGALLAGWFLIIHTRVAGERRLPKELAVGVFFAAATFIPTVARRPDLRPQLAPPAILFGALCALNCIFLYAWEHRTLDSPDVRSHGTTRFLAARLTSATLVLLATSCVCALLLPGKMLAGATGLSALVLLLLDRFRNRLPQLTLRAAADLALLTPVFFLWSPR